MPAPYTAFASGAPPATVAVIVSAWYSGTGVPPTWTNFTFASGVVGVEYSQQWDLAPAESPTTYTLTSGALPDGLELESVSGDLGRIHGTPTIAGTFTFTLRATNSAGISDKEFTLVIVAGGGGGARCYAWIG